MKFYVTEISCCVFRSLENVHASNVSRIKLFLVRPNVWIPSTRRLRCCDDVNGCLPTFRHMINSRFSYNNRIFLSVLTFLTFHFPLTFIDCSIRPLKFTPNTLVSSLTCSQPQPYSSAQPLDTLQNGVSRAHDHREIS